MTTCIKIIAYSILVNNEAVGPVILGRGLRQRDPFFPYLFIICVERLSSLIKQAKGRGDLVGTSIRRGAPIVTHLIFANGCFLFFKAEEC
jgi:hypothetical protein